MNSCWWFHVMNDQIIVLRYRHCWRIARIEIHACEPKSKWIQKRRPDGQMWFSAATGCSALITGINFAKNNCLHYRKVSIKLPPPAWRHLMKTTWPEQRSLLMVHRAPIERESDQWALPMLLLCTPFSGVVARTRGYSPNRKSLMGFPRRAAKRN